MSVYIKYRYTKVSYISGQRGTFPTSDALDRSWPRSSSFSSAVVRGPAGSARTDIRSSQGKACATISRPFSYWGACHSAARTTSYEDRESRYLSRKTDLVDHQVGIDDLDHDLGGVRNIDATYDAYSPWGYVSGFPGKLFCLSNFVCR